MKLLKAEKAALAALLSEGAESPEALADAFVARYWELLGEREFHSACFTYAGIPGSIGPFSTPLQARKAIEDAGVAEKFWIVPSWTPDGWKRHMADVDKAPEPYKLNAAEERKRAKGFWQRVQAIKEKDVTAITGNVTVRAIRLP